LRPRIAFFPLDAAPAPHYAPKSLPSNVYFGGPTNGTLGGSTTLGPNDFARRWFTGSSPGAVIVQSPEGIAWSQLRGAFVLGSTMFYGYSDGTFHRRSFDGVAFGPDIVIDPYNDPEWANELTGKSGGQTYRGVRPGFYGELSRVTGMFAAEGRLYYSLSGDANLYSRAFSADSGIVHPTRVTTPGGTLGNLAGLFFSGNKVLRQLGRREPAQPDADGRDAERPGHGAERPGRRRQRLACSGGVPRSRRGGHTGGDHRFRRREQLRGYHHVRLGGGSQRDGRS